MILLELNLGAQKEKKIQQFYSGHINNYWRCETEPLQHIVLNQAEQQISAGKK